MPNNNPQQQTSSSQQQQQQRSTEGSSKLSERLDQTTSSAIQRVRDAREQATSNLEHQRAEVASRIRRLGGVLRAGSETLSTDDPYSQNLLTVAGERVEQIADYVENLSPSQLADDVQDFARRRPGLFFGGAFLLGLGLGRFAKSSTRAVSGGGASNLYDEEYDDQTFAESDIGESYVGQQTASQQTTPRSNVGSTSPSYGSGGTTLPYGVGSSASGTVTTGSSYGPSSGVQSGPTGASGPTTTPSTTTPSTPGTGSASASRVSTDTIRTQSGAPSSNATGNASSTNPQTIDRGQGAKS